MYATTQVTTVVLIAIASVLATSAELAGIDSLSAPRAPLVRQAVVQLPTVFVTAQRAADERQTVVMLPTVTVTAPHAAQVVAEVRQLPRMTIVANRDARTAAARAGATASEI